MYGMTLSLLQILRDGSERLVFSGIVSPNIISQDMWPRAKCYDKRYQPYQNSFPLGSLSQTILTDVQ